MAMALAHEIMISIYLSTCMYVCMFISQLAQRSKDLYVCILYTDHTDVMISFGHGLNHISHNVIYVLTRDQMISGNVLFYSMGNTCTSPLGYFPSLKKWKG